MVPKENFQKKFVCPYIHLSCLSHVPFPCKVAEPKSVTKQICQVCLKGDKDVIRVYPLTVSLCGFNPRGNIKNIIPG